MPHLTELAEPSQRPRIGFIDYNSGYLRNQLVRKTLENQGVINATSQHSGLIRRNIATITSVLSKKIDSVIFLWPSYAILPAVLVLRVFTRKKIASDCFISMHNTMTEDRKIVTSSSIRGRYYYFLDWMTTHFADVLFFDTHEHRAYFLKKFPSLSKKRNLIIPVCIDETIIDQVSVPPNSEKLVTILFYGTHIPLHGIEYIIRAAKILSHLPLRLVLIGEGQTRQESERLASDLNTTNITFERNQPYPELLKQIKKADICLGIFSDSEKANIVIPNKILDYAGCSKIIITRKSEAMKRYFTDQDIVYCDPANPESLAQAIKHTYEHLDEMKSFGENAKRTFQKYFDSNALKRYTAELLSLL